MAARGWRLSSSAQRTRVCANLRAATRARRGGTHTLARRPGGLYNRILPSRPTRTTAPRNCLRPVARVLVVDCRLSAPNTTTDCTVLSRGRCVGGVATPSGAAWLAPPAVRTVVTSACAPSGAATVGHCCDADAAGCARFARRLSCGGAACEPPAFRPRGCCRRGSPRSGTALHSRHASLARFASRASAAATTASLAPNRLRVQACNWPRACASSLSSRTRTTSLCALCRHVFSRGSARLWLRTRTRTSHAGRLHDFPDSPYRRHLRRARLLPARLLTRVWTL